MDAVKNDVKRLVKIELAAANKKFRMFAGPHEGAGIIQEEVVEAVQEMNGLRQELNVMWMNVYSNNPQISTKGVYDRAVALAVEAIQTAAMARKFERSQRRNDMQDGLDNLYRRYVLPAPISDLMEIPYRAEQVWLVIRHALAWHDKPEGDPWNVCFDKPLNRSDQPQPVVKLNEKQEAKK